MHLKKDRLDRLLAAARECLTCGNPHKVRTWMQGDYECSSWADPRDGHPYRPRMRSDALGQLEQLAAGLDAMVPA